MEFTTGNVYPSSMNAFIHSASLTTPSCACYLKGENLIEDKTNTLK